MTPKRRTIITGGSVAGILVAPPALFGWLATNPNWGEFWAAAAQPYATVLVGLGAVTAAGLALWNGERERRQREQHEADRATRETKSALNDRYSELLAQLADKQPIIREGAVHGLVALSEDWAAFGDDKQHRVCVSLLVSYIRSAMFPRTGSGEHPDVPVRGTVVRLLSEFAQRRGLDGYRRELNLQGVDLRDVSLAQINLSGFWLDSARLSKADLSYADLSNANLTNSSIDDCDLTATNLTSATLQLASAKRTNLRRTNFTKGALFGADFTGAFIISPWPQEERSNHRGHDFMSQAPIFNEAYLIGANFTDANLSGARITDTHCEYVNFDRTTLYCADLSRSGVTGTDFRTADLTEAKIDTAIPNYDETRPEHNTKWPDGVTPPPALPSQTPSG